jgi:hypothetical protein
VNSLEQAALAVTEKHKVTGCFQFTFHEEVSERLVRTHKDRPEEVRVEQEVRLSFVCEAETIQKMTRLFGWRVYGTNQPVADFSRCGHALRMVNWDLWQQVLSGDSREPALRWDLLSAVWEGGHPAATGVRFLLSGNG